MMKREKINTSAVFVKKSTFRAYVLRTTSLVLLLVVFSTLLASCHGKAELNEFDIPTAFDDTKQYEITFWAKNESNAYQKSVYERAADEFEALYPNVDVKIKIYTNYDDVYKNVITNIPTNTTPNVCITYPDHIATYLEGENTVVCLDELMRDKRFGLGGSEVRFDAPTLDEIIPDFLEECYIGDSCYALPYMRSTEACYINKTYVEKLGYTVPDVLTWDFIWEVSEAALAKGEDGKYLVNGQDELIPFIYKSTDNMMIQMLEQLDAGLSTNEGEVLLFNDTTREVLTEIAEHVKSGAFQTFQNRAGYPANWLNVGRCIFAIDSTAGATWMGADAPLTDIDENDIVEFETVVRPVPQFNADNPEMISQGPSVCIFNKEDPGEVLASWLFVQYLLTDGIQIAYSQSEGYIPVTSSAHSNPEYVDYLSRAGERDADGEVVDLYYDVKIAAAKLLLANLDNTFTTEVFNGSASLRDAAGHIIEETVLAVRRKQQVNDAFFDKLFDSTVSIKRLDAINVEGKVNLGELPGGSVALLSVLGGTWVLIGAAFVTGEILRRRKNKKM